MEATVGDFALGVQAWIGTSAPDPNKIAVSGSEFPRWKPQDGFFTSTWDNDRESCAWLEHMQEHDERYPKREGRQVWTFAPDPAIRLYVIDSLEAFRELADEYPHRYANERNPTCLPDWYAIYTAHPRRFEAVHVTAQAAALLERWDVESTLWFALQRFPDLRQVGPVGEHWKIQRA